MNHLWIVPIVFGGGCGLYAAAAGLSNWVIDRKYRR